ncbi:hypothetical protein Nepgr_002961 [Nepenthes gracilis]|uniref:Bidirectional sugar transporter SWEET n=1 Tax=Nepenthes gracilis TaxID=150966 RepID=A0AAD3XCN1_NEPGR|nr:hypothetical protein Nepgr_002961 [Nepenthes gracilis]
MLWVYYGLLKSNAVLLITINTVGCVIEAIYVALYLTYAPKPAKLPNISGFIFGVAQMVLYGVYRKYDKFAVQNQKLPEELPTSAKLSTISMTTAAEIHPMDSLREVDEIKEEYQDQDLHDDHESSNCRDGIKIDTSCGSSTIQLVECSA